MARRRQWLQRQMTRTRCTQWKNCTAWREGLCRQLRAACHQANGQGLPPAFPPLVGSKVVLGPQDGQIDILLNGKSGNTAMAAFKHLSDTDIAAVITYTRNSWGNDRRSRSAVGHQGGAQVSGRLRTFSQLSRLFRRSFMAAIPGGADHAHDHDHHHHPSGIMRWVTTTNHKDIGSMYLWFSFAMFIVGGIMALVIRAELFQPGLQVVDPDRFNQMTTLHGLIMVFGAIMPAFVGFANWMIPLMIGASDMAFARMNNWSFWLLPPAGILLTSSLLVPGGAAGFGLDALSAADRADGHRHGHGDLRGAHPRHLVDHGFDQHRHDDPEHARAGHDADEDAAVLLDLADHRLPRHRGDAGAGRCGHHDPDRPSLRHQLLQRRRWR
jgi:hypothetical protein